MKKAGISIISAVLGDEETTGVSLVGGPRSGKTNLIKEIVNTVFKYTIPASIFILSDNNEYQDNQYIKSIHVKMSPVMLNAHVNAAINNCKVPNIIMNRNYGSCDLRRAFSTYLRFKSKMLVMDDITFILPKNIRLNLVKIKPILVYQSYNHLPNNLQELVQRYCNMTIDMNKSTAKKTW